MKTTHLRLLVLLPIAALLSARQPSAIGDPASARAEDERASARLAEAPAARRRQPSAPRAVDPVKEKRLEWFREAKYGLFIHWGLYAIPAGQWNGKRSPGLGEWVMFRSRVPVAEYEKLTTRFNPVKF